MTKFIHLRRATIADTKFLLFLRNNPTNVANSFSRTQANEADFSAWLSKCLKGQISNRLVFIAENESGIPIGSVRAIEHSDATEISYTIDPSFRGQGFGKLMVKKFVSKCLKGKKLKAIIKKGNNEASEAIAKAIGLTPASETQSNDPEDPRIIVTWE